MTDTLAGKIAKASGDLGNRLKADKKNTQGGGYMYISADKLIAEAGAVLAANGVAVFPSIVGYNVDGGESSGGKRNYIVTVNFMMVVTDGVSQMDCPWIGAGVDYGAMDKALYKGITSGHKYFLAKLLNIGEGNEDSEHEATPAEAPAKPQAQPVAQQRPASNGTVMARANANTAAFNGFMAKGNDLFGSADWADARHWLIRRYTTKNTPDNVRESANDLTQDELTALRGDMDKYNGKLVSAWEQHKMERRTELDGITVNGAQEMAH